MTKKPERAPCRAHQCRGGSANWCGIVFEGGVTYLVRDWGHWLQMSETEQICAVKGARSFGPIGNKHRGWRRDVGWVFGTVWG